MNLFEAIYIYYQGHNFPLALFGVATKNMKLFSSEAKSSIINFPNVHVILAKCHS